jgi:hypothetical protein
VGQRVNVADAAALSKALNEWLRACHMTGEQVDAELEQGIADALSVAAVGEFVLVDDDGEIEASRPKVLHPPRPSAPPPRVAHRGVVERERQARGS